MPQMFASLEQPGLYNVFLERARCMFHTTVDATFLCCLASLHVRGVLAGAALLFYCCMTVIVLNHWSRIADFLGPSTSVNFVSWAEQFQQTFVAWLARNPAQRKGCAEGLKGSSRVTLDEIDEKDQMQACVKYAQIAARGAERAWIELWDLAPPRSSSLLLAPPGPS